MDRCIHALKYLLRLSAKKSYRTSVFDNMPDEMILFIFKMLPLSDLKNAIMVCRKWYRIGTEPKLWTDSRITINYRNVKMLKEIIYCQWLSSVTSVKLLAWLMPKSCTDLVLREIIRRDRFQELLVRGNGFTEVDSELLSFCLNSMKRVCLSMTLSHCQMEAFFRDLEHKTSITELVIEVQDLTKVNEGVLCNCVRKLQKVKLIKTKLLESQRRSLRMELRDDYLKIIQSEP